MSSSTLLQARLRERRTRKNAASEGCVKIWTCVESKNVFTWAECRFFLDCWTASSWLQSRQSEAQAQILLLGWHRRPRWLTRAKTFDVSMRQGCLTPSTHSGKVRRSKRWGPLARQRKPRIVQLVLLGVLYTAHISTSHWQPNGLTKVISYANLFPFFLLNPCFPNVLALFW